jgi:hypothetical protein
MGSTLPKARANDLIESTVGDQVVVYDETTHQIHRLNSTMITVRGLCDGSRSVQDIAHELAKRTGEAWSVHTIVMSIEQLQEAGLLEPGSHVPPATRRSFRERRTSRRTLAAGAIALPMIFSASAASAGTISSLTATACFIECSSNQQCSGCCSTCNLPDANATPNPTVGFYTCYNRSFHETNNAYRC